MTETDHPKPMEEHTADSLRAFVYSNRQDMGKAAALHVAGSLQTLLENQEEVRMVVASAPSQNEFFNYLLSAEISADVDWSRIVVFHMDEYVGLSADHPQSFRAYQQAHFVGKVKVKAFYPIQGEADNPQAECERLSKLIAENPIDLVCCGIGENGHLAFNDPPVADFEDPRLVKVVAMDEICRQQQVNDGCFASIEEVPTHAITLTLTVFDQSKQLSCVVPAKSKAEAVAATLEGPISTDCPATIMRLHANARMFLDIDSAKLLSR